MASDTEKQIRDLLERYFEGATTLDEERRLREYFSCGREIPDDLRYAGAMFGAFRESAEAKPAASGFGTQQTRRGRTNHRTGRTVWLWAGSAAAVVAVVLALRLAHPGADAPATPETVYCYVNGQPVTDYETARQYAEGTLDVIAASLHKPMEYFVPLERFDEVFRMLDALSNLDFTDANPSISILNM